MLAVAVAVAVAVIIEFPGTYCLRCINWYLVKGGGALANGFDMLLICVMQWP